MFTVENMDHSIVKFTIIGILIHDDVVKILGIISRIFETKKLFSFIVHIDIKEYPNSTTIPQMIKTLVTWMKANNQNIITSLQSSSIVIKSQTFTNVVNGIFKIQPTIKPNKIFTNINDAETFVKNIMIKNGL